MLKKGPNWEVCFPSLNSQKSCTKISLRNEGFPIVCLKNLANDYYEAISSFAVVGSVKNWRLQFFLPLRYFSLLQEK